MPYEAILFDMDGVIIDTQQSVTTFWQHFAQVHGVRLTPADFEQHIYGCPGKHTLDVFFPHLPAQERQAVFDRMADYEKNLTYQAMAGALTFLRTLKQNHIPTALVTSGAQWKVDEVSRQLKLDGLFSVYVTVENVQRGKPHPDCYLQAAKFLQKKPERCIVFEDALSGVQAAVAAGALCIGVQNSNLGENLWQAGAYYVVPNLDAVDLLIPQDKVEGLRYLQLGSEGICLSLQSKKI
ncbi:MAG: HAD family phosphatase [Anaerolineae bacterium]|nr:HAD family phosphatase [Anaerolineae bacterium]